MSGSLNDQLVDLSEQGVSGRILDLHVGDLEAELAGLSCGGHARCLLVPAADMPAELWERLRNRDPVRLRTHVDGDRVLDVSMLDPATVADAGEDAAQLFRRGKSDTLVAPGEVITVLWPVPKLVIVGSGAIGDALSDAAGLLGWDIQVITDVRTATGVIAGLAVLDKMVVISHDDDLAGPALKAALAGEVGYTGAPGVAPDAAVPGPLAGLSRHHRPGARPRPGGVGHRRQHAGGDRGCHPRRGACGQVGEDRGIATRAVRVDPLERLAAG